MVLFSLATLYLALGANTQEKFAVLINILYASIALKHNHYSHRNCMLAGSTVTVII